MGSDQQGHAARPARMPLGPDESARAARRWWDADAGPYALEHGAFLDGDLVWGPEGLAESGARLLGPSVDGLRVLELGCGAAQGASWLAGQGADVVGLDVSGRMLATAHARDPGLALVQATGDRLPLADGSVDAVVSAHGAFAFLADLGAALREVRRVLVPGGRLVFSVTHPVRWAFADDPGPGGLTAAFSYFDRRAYVELDAGGEPVYVEHHRTLGDTVEAIVTAGLVVERLVEPEWPDWNTRTWGAWSPERGEVLPGTAVWCCRRPAVSPSPG